jgi:hypothetical protein
VDTGAVLRGEVRAEWRAGEGRYLALLFRRALHWLGVLDLAFDAQGRLQAFRVTEPGARLLAGAAATVAAVPPAVAPAATIPKKKPTKKQPTKQQPPSWAVRDDGVLVSLAGLRAGAVDLEAALAWCEPAGATSEGLLLRPTARRVAAALDAGHALEAWLAWLEANTAANAARGALLARLRGWAARYGRARLYPAVALLEVADAALMRELERVASLDARRDHALSPELAVIRSADVEPLLEELRRRGYAPWMMPDETAH